jgi:hypothetical protein
MKIFPNSNFKISPSINQDFAFVFSYDDCIVKRIGQLSLFIYSLCNGQTMEELISEAQNILIRKKIKISKEKLEEEIFLLTSNDILNVKN